MKIPKPAENGGGKAFAAISVTFPEGSKCFCSNGSKTLKAKTTSGSYLFVVHDGGEWEITITDGTQVKTESVEVTLNSVHTIAMRYRLMVFDKDNYELYADKFEFGKLGNSYTYNNLGVLDQNGIYITSGSTNSRSCSGVSTTAFAWKGYDKLVIELEESQYGSTEDTTSKPRLGVLLAGTSEEQFETEALLGRFKQKLFAPTSTAPWICELSLPSALTQLATLPELVRVKIIASRYNSGVQFARINRIYFA